MTSEYFLSGGPQFHDAIAAWTRGYNGNGVTIAVIDSGIDTDSPEFAGRISSASVDVAGNGTIEAEGDHGTHVAMVAAAARDNTGIMGIAYNATIMAIRADDPGSCASGDCSFLDDDIAAGIVHAVANGARIINISLGGGIPSVSVRNAIADASAAGVMVVVAAGNDGATVPDPFATGIRQSGRTNVIIAGSVDSSGTISDFSNRAGLGPNANYYLAALGEALCCVYEDGALYEDSEGYVYVVSGTSYAAPQIAGAAALLAQAFPNLTGDDIVSLLLSTAADAGEPGKDLTYGRGILDIGAAFQPVGTTSLANSRASLPLGDTVLVGSAAMGDSVQTASLGAVILDGYDRAFAVDLARQLRSAAVSRKLDQALSADTVRRSGGGEALSYAFSVDARGTVNRMPWVGALHLSQDEADGARVLAGRVAYRLSPKAEIGFAFAEGADGLVAQLQGQDRPAFFIADHATADDGFRRDTDFSFAMRRRLGQWGVTVSAESGRMLSSAELNRRDALAAPDRRNGVRTYGAAFDRDWGNFTGAVAASWMHEADSVLGARLHEGLAAGGADTVFVDARAGWNFASRWKLGVAMRNGWTRARTSGAIAAGSQIATRSWSIDLVRHGFSGKNDTLALRLAQPLRVEGGGLNIELPVAYDYATGTSVTGIHRINLAPSGREIIGELAWSAPMLSGHAAASLFYRRQPGHYASVHDDQGVALRWTKGF